MNNEYERANEIGRELADVNSREIMVDNRIQNGDLGCKPTVNDGPTTTPNSSSKVATTRMRFVVCTLGIFAIALSKMNRGSINYCITQMVDPKMFEDDNKATSSDGSCPMPLATFQHELPAISVHPDDLHDGHTENTVTTYNDGQPNLMENSFKVNNRSEKFMWTIKEQSYVKGGFYYSYFFFMVLGGRLAEIYGAKYALLLAVAGSGLINLATPWLARIHVGLVIASRILMGALQSSFYPATYALFNRWLTMGEVSIYSPMIKLFLGLGQVLAGLVPGLVTGWPNAFYVTGSISMVWAILWLFLATSDPSSNKFVSETELTHITRKKKMKKMIANSSMKINTSGSGEIMSQDETMQPSTFGKTPWLKILTEPSVIGLTIIKLTDNFCNDFISVELPSYLKYVHHASIQRISATTTTMFGVQMSLVLFVGWLAKVMVQKRPYGLSKTATRKIFASLSSAGSGTMLFMLIFADCNLTLVTIILPLICLFAVFVVGGEMMLPYDLSEEYPATIMAIANSVANTSGTIVTFFTGIILGDKGGSQARWNTVIALISSAQCLGCLIFCVLIKAKPIDLEPSRTKHDSSSKDVELALSDTSQRPINSANELVDATKFNKLVLE